MKVILSFDSMEEMEAFRNGNNTKEMSTKSQSVLPNSTVSASQQTTPPMTPAAPVPVANVTPCIPVVPQAVAPPTPLQPVMPQTTVPTTAVAQEFSYDQLAVAAAGLVNSGKQPKLFGILQQFGVQAMTELPKERYGEFATALRAEGAVI